MLEWRREVMIHGSDVDNIAMNVTQTLLFSLSPEELQALTGAMQGSSIYWDKTRAVPLKNPKDMATSFERTREGVTGEACGLVNEVSADLRRVVLDDDAAAAHTAAGHARRSMLKKTGILVREARRHYRSEYTRVQKKREEIDREMSDE